MPTIGHAAIGFAAARTQGRRGQDLAKDMLLFGALGALPDLDLVPYLFGRSDLVPLGHRGATHSLLFAVVVGAAVGLLSGRGSRVRRFLLASLVVASHGLVDPLNTSSHGTAIFWPFSDAALSWSVHPIPITPVGLELFTRIGLTHLVTETLLFAPFLVYAFWPRARRQGAAERATPAVLRGASLAQAITPAPARRPALPSMELRPGPAPRGERAARGNRIVRAARGQRVPTSHRVTRGDRAGAASAASEP